MEGAQRRADVDRRRQRPRACSRSTRPPRWCRRPPTPDANIIFGTVIDDSLGDEVRVTVIAAGFEATGPGRKPVVGAGAQSIAPGKAGKVSIVAVRTRPTPPACRCTPNGATVSIGGDDDDDVDVPPFMRH